MSTPNLLLPGPQLYQEEGESSDSSRDGPAETHQCVSLCRTAPGEMTLNNLGVTTLADRGHPRGLGLFYRWNNAVRMPIEALERQTEKEVSPMGFAVRGEHQGVRWHIGVPLGLGGFPPGFHPRKVTKIAQMPVSPISRACLCFNTLLQKEKMVRRSGLKESCPEQTRLQKSRGVTDTLPATQPRGSPASDLRHDPYRGLDHVFNQPLSRHVSYNPKPKEGS